MTTSYPDSVFAAVPIAGAARHSAQNIAFHEVGRQAIMADPDWCGGRYLSLGRKPVRGLAVARMAAHITYLSERRCTANLGATCRTAAQSLMGSTPIFRSKAICATRAALLSTGSTRTPTSISRGRWIISTSRPSIRDRCPSAFSGTPLAVLHHLLYQRLAVSDPGKPGGRARVERGGGQCQLCRDRDRQRPRLVPAARARAIRDVARVFERLRRAPRPDSDHVMPAISAPRALSLAQPLNRRQPPPRQASSARICG